MRFYATHGTDVRPVSGRFSAEFGENRITGSSEPHRPGYVTGPLCMSKYYRKNEIVENVQILLRLFTFRSIETVK